MVFQNFIGQRHDRLFRSDQSVPHYVNQVKLACGFDDVMPDGFAVSLKCFPVSNVQVAQE